MAAAFFQGPLLKLLKTLPRGRWNYLGHPDTIIICRRFTRESPPQVHAKTPPIRVGTLMPDNFYDMDGLRFSNPKARL
jgi:hypothetical protein